LARDDRMSVECSRLTVQYLIDAEVVKSKTEASGGNGRVQSLDWTRRLRAAYSAPHAIAAIMGSGLALSPYSVGDGLD